MKWYLVKLDRYSLGTAATTCPAFSSKEEAEAYSKEKGLVELSAVFGSIDDFGIVSFELTKQQRAQVCSTY